MLLSGKRLSGDQMKVSSTQEPIVESIRQTLEYPVWCIEELPKDEHCIVTKNANSVSLKSGKNIMECNKSLNSFEFKFDNFATKYHIIIYHIMYINIYTIYIYLALFSCPFLIPILTMVHNTL